MELGVERVVKGPQPLQVIRRGMAVPTATDASRSARLRDVFDVVWYLAAAERLYNEGWCCRRGGGWA